MTWNAALVFTFGAPVPGREAAALHNLADAQNFFGKLAAEDKCETESYLWMTGGGEMIVKGESPIALFEILGMEEARKLISVANYTSQDFGYRLAMTGEGLPDELAIYSSVGSELGYL